MPRHPLANLLDRSISNQVVAMTLFMLSPLLLLSPMTHAQTPPGDCPGQPDVIEGESCGSQSNPGCQSPNPAFTEVTCGDLVCATSWASGGFSDIDWYRLQVEDLDGSGQDQIQIQIRSSLPLLARIRLGCPEAPVRITDSQFDPMTAEWVVDLDLCAMANTEVLMQLQPGFKASGPILEGYPCDNAGYPYNFSVGCSIDCDETLCPVCVQSPEGLVGWWMLDEDAGGSLAGDVVANHNATFVGSVISGSQGIVDNAVELDGSSAYMKIEDALQLNFEANDDFTLMAWINADVATGTRIIFSKITSQAPFRGWGLGLDGNNNLLMTLADDSGLQIFSSTAFVPANRWVHVAVSVDRDQIDGLRFYIDGEPAGTADPTQHQLDLTNDRPVYLGCTEVPSGLTRFFPGSMDEVMIVDYPLDNEEVLEIARAQCGGVCKQRLHITRFTPFCDNQGEASAVVTIFNDRPQGATYELTFDGLPANGNDCNIDGPVNFMTSMPNPIVVPPLGRQEVNVTMTRPQAMLEDGDTGCWRSFIQESTHLEPVETRRAFVIQSDTICVEPLGLPEGVQGLPLNSITPVEFLVHNLGQNDYQLVFKIFAIDSITGLPNTLLRLNMEEPGDGVVGMITIPPMGSELVGVETQWVFTRSDDEESTKGQITDVVMYEDPGKIEPDTGIGSKGTESTERAQSVCDEADINCDGVVNVDDLLELLSQYGECPDPTDCSGDLDGDGDVDVNDLLSLLAAYGGP